MPRLTQWYLRAALLYLVLALLTGAILAARTILGLPSYVVKLQPVFFHLFMVGWVTQLIFGVVYWMFPKYSSDRPYRSEVIAWSTFLTLNLGLLMRAFVEPLLSSAKAPLVDWLSVLSALLQLMSGIGFVFNTWSRVKAR